MASLDFQPSLTDLPAGALVHILGLLKSLKDISSAQIVATSIADAANVVLQSWVSWSSSDHREVSHLKAARLFKFLARHCPQLRSITCCFAADRLYGGTLLETSLGCLAASAQHLTHLTLLNVDVTDTVLQQLGRHCTQLQHLAIGRSEGNAFGTYISDQGLTLLAGACKQLTSLCLFRCYSCSDVGLRELARQGLHLTNLVLHSCPQVTAAGLVRFIEGTPMLQHLDVLLPESGPGGSAVNFDTCFALAAHCSNLKVLRVSEELLSGGVLDDSCVGVIARGCKGLQEVELVQVEVTDAAVADLATHCTQLTSLRLEQTYVGDQGVHKVLAACPDLRELRVAGCSTHSWMLPAEFMFAGLSVAGLKKVATAKGIGSKLTSLDLSCLALEQQQEQQQEAVLPVGIAAATVVLNNNAAAAGAASAAGGAAEAPGVAAATVVVNTVAAAGAAAAGTAGGGSGPGFPGVAAAQVTAAADAAADAALLDVEDAAADGGSTSSSSSSSTAATNAAGTPSRGPTTTYSGSSSSGRGSSGSSSSGSGGGGGSSGAGALQVDGQQQQQLLVDKYLSPLLLIPSAWCMQLTSLSLDWLKVDGRTLQEPLVATLRWCGSLTRLSLVGYQGSVDGLLSAAAEAGAALTQLNLQHSQVTDEGLSIAASQFRSLQVLYLSYCRLVGDAGLGSLLDMHALQELDLYNTPCVSTAAVARIARHAPTLRRIYIGHNTSALNRSPAQSTVMGYISSSERAKYASSTTSSVWAAVSEAAACRQSGQLSVLCRNPSSESEFEKRSLQTLLEGGSSSCGC